MLAVLAVGTLLLATRLADLPLLDPDEAKHAQVAREMLEAGRWIEPLVYGQDYHHKPSLLYALIRLCYRVVGINELGARLVPALAGLATLVLVFGVGARRRAPVGLVAALLLGSSPLFLAVSRFTNFDVLLTLVTFAAVVSAARWIESEGKDGGALVGAVSLCALGVLVKGPVAAVLLALPVAAIGWREIRATPLRIRIAAASGFSMILGVWLFPALWLHPEYVANFLWVHNVQRYSVDADLFHPEPFWFFVPVVLATTLPWSCFIIPAVRAAWRRGGADRFYALYAVWVIAFFSLSNGKLATYVLPSYPVLALLVACWLDSESDAEERAARIAVHVTSVVFLMAPFVAYGVLRVEEPGYERLAFALVPPATVAAALLLARARWRGSVAQSVQALAIAMLVAYAVVLAWFAPLAGELSSDRDLAQALEDRRETPDQVVVYRVRPYSFLFYTDWPLVYKVPEEHYRAALISPGRVWVLSKESRMKEFPAGDPPVRLREIARNRRHVVYERLNPPPPR